jgi:cell division protein FtsQ
MGPDQRYWRSRGNRRVRKARRLVHLTRWSLILAANGLVATALVLASRDLLDYLTTTDEFAVTRIDVRGLERASSETIDAQLADYIGSNILELNLDRIETEVQADPWVRRAAVRRVLPGMLHVRVEERSPVAQAIIADRPHLVDSTGYVIGPATSADDARLPVLSGLEKLDEARLRAALMRGVTVLRRLRRASDSFAERIGDLDLSREDRVALRTTDGGPTILLDPERVEQNIAPFLELRDAIQARVGTASYVDLRWRDRISVMPAGNTMKRNMGIQGRGR